MRTINARSSLHPLLSRSPASTVSSIHTPRARVPFLSSSRSTAMEPIRNRKRAAAVLDGDHATQGSATCCNCKKRRIGSDYEEESFLGEGGFGVVVKARHLVTGKSVAIKFLRSDNDSDVGELLREAYFLEACSGNPYLVGFEGLVRDPTTGDLCFAMEYVGPNLESFLRERSPLPEATVRSFMFQLLTSAKEMQERQIIHRDIKPANVLVAEGGELVKICDLGLAMSMSEPTPYIQAGTMFYMAPEMLLGKPDYGALVDSWSLGCVMAELVTGKTLFQQPDKANEIRQLFTIFRVLGMPNGRTWPGVASLPLAAAVRARLLGQKRSELRQLFPEEMLSKDGFDVLEGLLTCNPNKRLTVAAALKLPWFAPLCATAAAKVDRLVLPTKEMATALPAKKKLRIKIIPPVALKEELQVKIIPPVSPKKKLRIKIVPPATPKKNVLRIPLAICKEHGV